MDAVMRYFRDRAVVRIYDIVMTGSRAIVVPADPMRYAISVNNNLTNNTSIEFPPLAATGQPNITVPAGSGPVVLTEDVLGELIRLPIIAYDTDGGGYECRWYTVSYDPSKYEEMKRYVRGCLSQYGPL